MNFDIKDFLEADVFYKALNSVSYENALITAKCLGIHVSRIFKDGDIRYLFVGETKVYHNGRGGRDCWRSEAGDGPDYIGNVIISVIKGKLK